MGDFSLGTSYGSIPCNLCASQEPVCLVTDSSMTSNGEGGAVGICSCMQQTTFFQSCSRADMAMRVVPDASQMCAVSLHAGASMRSVSAMYEWGYLAATPCVLISMGNAYCYEVSRYGLLVVGHGVVRTASSILRRRLLAMESEDASKAGDSLVPRLLEGIHSFGSWNHTAQPCKGLAEALVLAAGENNTGGSIVRMGVMDMQQLESCLHWRQVCLCSCFVCMLGSGLCNVASVFFADREDHDPSSQPDADAPCFHGRRLLLAHIPFVAGPDHHCYEEQGSCGPAV